MRSTNVAGNQPGNFAEHRERIEGAQLWLQTVGHQPDCMTVGFRRLAAPRDWPRSAVVPLFAEGYKRLYIDAHRSGEAHQNLENRV